MSEEDLKFILDFEINDDGIALEKLLKEEERQLLEEFNEQLEIMGEHVDADREKFDAMAESIKKASNPEAWEDPNKELRDMVEEAKKLNEELSKTPTILEKMSDIAKTVSEHLGKHKSEIAEGLGDLLRGKNTGSEGLGGAFGDSLDSGGILGDIEVGGFKVSDMKKIAEGTAFRIGGDSELGSQGHGTSMSEAEVKAMREEVKQALKESYGETAGGFLAGFGAETAVGQYANNTKLSDMYDRTHRFEDNNKKYRADRDRRLGEIGDEEEDRLRFAKNDPYAVARMAGNFASKFGAEAEEDGDPEFRTKHLEEQVKMLERQKQAQGELYKEEQNQLRVEEDVLDAKKKQLDLMERQLQKSKEAEQSTAQAIGAMTDSERLRAERALDKLDSGEEINKAEKDVLRQTGGYGRQIANEYDEMKGREVGGGLIDRLGRAAGANVPEQQKEFNQAQEDYNKRKDAYTDTVSKFKTDVSSFTETIDKKIAEVGEILAIAAKQLKEQKQAALQVALP